MVLTLLAVVVVLTILGLLLLLRPHMNDCQHRNQTMAPTSTKRLSSTLPNRRPQLMEETLLEQRDSLRRNGIRLTAIGELDRLPARLRSLLLEIQEDSISGSPALSTPLHSSTKNGVKTCPKREFQK